MFAEEGLAVDCCCPTSAFLSYQTSLPLLLSLFVACSCGSASWQENLFCVSYLFDQSPAVGPAVGGGGFPPTEAALFEIPVQQNA